MSKRSCEYCRYLTDGCRCSARDERITSSSWFDDGCPHFKELKQTVFEKITANIEVLAEEFVDTVYDRVACEYRNYSMLTAEFYNNRTEALTATIEELNKEVNNE